MVCDLQQESAAAASTMPLTVVAGITAGSVSAVVVIAAIVGIIVFVVTRSKLSPKVHSRNKKSGDYEETTGQSGVRIKMRRTKSRECWGETN